MKSGLNGRGEQRNQCRSTSADQLQERTNHQCTLYLQRKNAGGGRAESTLQRMQRPGRRLRRRDTLAVLEVGLTRERSKTASTAPRWSSSRTTDVTFHQPQPQDGVITSAGGGQAHREHERHDQGNTSHGALC